MAAATRAVITNLYDLRIFWQLLLATSSIARRATLAQDRGQQTGFLFEARRQEAVAAARSAGTQLLQLRLPVVSNSILEWLSSLLSS